MGITNQILRSVLNQTVDTETTLISSMTEAPQEYEINELVQSRKVQVNVDNADGSNGIDIQIETILAIEETPIWVPIEGHKFTDHAGIVGGGISITVEGSYQAIRVRAKKSGATQSTQVSASLNAQMGS